MMNGGDASSTSWTVTRDGQVAFSGDEAAARAFCAEWSRAHPDHRLRLYRPAAVSRSPKAAEGDKARRKLARAREEVLRAVHSRSNEDLMPALESLVQAKIQSAYVEDGGLIDTLRQMRSALEAIHACIPPSDRALLDQPGAAAYARVPLSAEAYRELRAALRERQE